MTGWVMILFVFLMLWVTFFYAGPQEKKIDSWSQFITFIKNEKVELDSVRIEPGYVYATMKPDVMGYEKTRNVYVNTTDATELYQNELTALNVPYTAQSWIQSFWSQLLIIVSRGLNTGILPLP